MVRIGIDAMGGDNAPEVVVKGAVAAQRLLGADVRLVLYGQEQAIRAYLPASCDIDIVHTSQVIAMHDHPAESFIQKRNSSIVVAFNDLAAGKIDALASAGSTGAMLIGAMRVIGPLPGVLRPAIAISIPSIASSKVTILDIGINVDCKPEVLEQYGAIGSIYSNRVLGIDNPRVALLNIGEEATKGNSQAKATYALMQASSEQGRYNFVGNIEASQLFTGTVADVVVCDGFVGNTIIKLTEGLHAINSQAALMNNFWHGLNYETIGGTPILGISAPVTVAHGKSTPEAIKNMILATFSALQSELISAIKERV